jgi:hypothetical protein
MLVHPGLVISEFPAPLCITAHDALMAVAARPYSQASLLGTHALQHQLSSLGKRRTAYKKSLHLEVHLEVLIGETRLMQPNSSIHCRPQTQP